MKKLLMVFTGLLAALTLQACSFSTANLTDVRLCTDPDSEGACSTDNPTFKTTDEEIFLSAMLNNAPGGTRVTATWMYLRGELGDEPIEIDTVSDETEESGSMPFYSSLTKPEMDWPTGEYEVTLTLSSDNSEPVTKPFSIR